MKKEKENKFEIEYNRLNLQQKLAVDNIYWQIMVLAWPWAWKTQIIWLRTANILLKTDLSPDNILITSFTEAWVIAIKKRLVKILWTDWYKVNVSTIHSFASEVIKTFPEKFIEYKAWILIDDIDSLEIFKKILDNLLELNKISELTNFHDKYYFISEIKKNISILKQEAISIEQFKRNIEKQDQIYLEKLENINPKLKKYELNKLQGEKHIKKLYELAIFFEEYNIYLKKYSLYDFNDMVNFVVEKFNEDIEIRQYYAIRYQFIMIDEYQDTNNAQNKLIDYIIQESNESNIMNVWDDDQSIYRFQWANIENMLNFSTKYKDTKFIVLNTNYRSNQEILNLSESLILNNNERLTNKITSISKNLVSNKWYSWQLPKLYEASDEIDEQNFIINQIKKLLEEGEKAEEIAIILRTNKELSVWSDILQKNSIEIESKLKTNILNSNYINFILDYLELIENPYSNEEKLINIMSSKISALDRLDIIKINRELYKLNYRLKIKITIFDFLSHIEKNIENNELNFNNVKLLVNFKENLLDLNSSLNSLNLLEFISYFIDKIEIIKYIEQNWNFNDIEDVYTLFNTIKLWSWYDNKLSISKIISKISLYKQYNYPINRQILSEKRWWVQILTAHSSKWLEYNNVFIVWLYNWNWDSKRQISLIKLPEKIVWEWMQELSNKNEIEEDRRLLFVALTRARNSLYLSYPKTKDKKILIESQFIWEIQGFYEKIDNYEKKIETDILIWNLIKNNLIEYTNIELEYIKNFFEDYKLSASDLNIFIKDPIRFLHIIIFKYPFIDNKYTIFWKVYHKTLELFYIKFKNDNKLASLSYLKETFSFLINKEFLNKEELENALEKWLKWLEGYYNRYKSTFKIPIKLEYKFKNKNLFFENIPINWTIDKIELKNSNYKEINTSQWLLFKEDIILIDYKTWTVKTKSEMKWLDKFWNKKIGEWDYFRQLCFYKLLCENDPEINNKYNISWLAIDFVEWKNWKYEYVELDCSNEEYESFKEELRNRWENMKDINFWKNILDIK